MSYLYFIEKADGPIKIGYTTNPRQRLSNLQVSTPDNLSLFALVRGTEEDEKKVHNDLSDFNVGGEWFERCPLVHSYIEQLLSERETIDPQRTRSRNTPPNHEMAALEAAKRIVKEMMLIEWREGASMSEAIDLVAAKAGLPSGAIWALRYRPGPSVTAGVFFALNNAWIGACDEQIRFLNDEMNQLATMCVAGVDLE